MRPSPPDYGEVAGYIVAVWEHGALHDNWDGVIHTTRDAAVESIREASNAGWTCFLTELRIVEVNPDVH